MVAESPKKRRPAGRSLASLFFAHAGKGVDKWEQYLGIYEHELHARIAAGKPLRLLEIGVQNGGSLELWEKYLPAGSQIVGLDIDPKVASLAFGDRRIRVEIADATDAGQLKHAIGDSEFDVIIDDGSHRCADVRATFGILFDHLAAGGLYVIEDLHCSYYPSHGGGLGKDDTSIEYLKPLIDALNHDHISRDDLETSDGAMSARLNRELARITFYDSVAVVEKLGAEKTGPYRRLLSGADTMVQPFENWLPETPPSQLCLILFGAEAATSFERVFVAQVEEERRRAAAARAKLVAKAKLCAKAVLRKRKSIAEQVKTSKREVRAGAAGQDDGSDLETIVAEQSKQIKALLKLVGSAASDLKALEDDDDVGRTSSSRRVRR